MRIYGCTAVLLLLLLVAGTPASHAQGIISTAAGGGPNNIPALSAGVDVTATIAEDASGNLYFVAARQNRVFKVTPSGQLTVFAGNGICCVGGFAGEGGPATDATLGQPVGVAADSSGNVFIVDSIASVVFSVREVAATTGQIHTVIQIPRSNNGSGPTGLAVDKFGNLFIPGVDNLIYEFVAATGQLQKFAGTGVPGFSGDGGPAINAQLFGPSGVFADRSGNVFIADQGNNRIREVQASTGAILTVAGNGTAGFSGDGSSATSAELNQPTGVSVDVAGNVYIADFNNERVREVAASTGFIKTVAGTGTQGFSGDGGPAATAKLNNAFNVWAESSGDVLIADTGNFRIRRITTSTGKIQTFVGNGSPFFDNADGFSALDISMMNPGGLVVDGSGNAFVSTVNVIRELVASTGKIQTVAGNGTAGNTGDGGPATSAELSGPGDIAIDSAGNLFVTSSTDPATVFIREVIAATGQIQNVQTIATGGCVFPNRCRPLYIATQPAGGVVSSFTGGIRVDKQGNTFTADTANCAVSELVASTNQTIRIAGNGICSFSGDGGPATTASLNGPTAIALDEAGNLFISDAGNARVRELLASSGVIVTVAGNGTRGFSGDGGPATQASLGVPGSVAIDRTGNLWISDFENMRVREVSSGFGVAAALLSPGSITFTPAVFVGSSAAPQSISLTNGGSTSLNITSIGIAGANVGDFAETDNCGGAVIVGASCTIAVTFHPATTGSRVASLTITDNAPDSPQTVLLTGVGAAAPFAPSPTSLTFNAQGIGTTSPAQTITLTNNSSTPVGISTVAVTGTNPVDFAQTNTCTGTIAAGSNCTISVTFLPSAAGPRAAAVTITDNAANSPQVVSLTGAGLSVSLGPASGGSASAVVTAGQTASYSLQVSAAGGAGSMTASVSCTGAPAGASCNVPATLNLIASGATPLTVTVTTMAHSTLVYREIRPQAPISIRMLFSATSVVFLTLMWLLRRRQLLYPCGQARVVSMSVACSFALLLLAGVFFAGCGGGGSSPAPSGGTPAGIYTLLVKVAAGGTTGSTQLTLRVQ